MEDSRHFISTLESVYLPGNLGRPRKRSRYIVADKGYDSDELRRYCDRHGMKPVIAQCNMYRRRRPGLPRRFDKPKYRQRNAVERCFSWLKELCCIATLYDKLASSFRAMVCVACHAMHRPLLTSRLFVQNLGHHELTPWAARGYQPVETGLCRRCAEPKMGRRPHLPGDR